jgi:LPS sulfotransferase NodH
MIKLREFLELIPNPSSIAVVTSYRTGSTALCDYLSNYLSIPNFDEAFHRCNNPETYKNYQYKEHCVLKIMQDQLIEPYWTDVKDRFILVGLYRRDLARQAASWYISMQLGDYHLTVDDSHKSAYEIPIYIWDIENTCKSVHKFNKLYQEKRSLFTAEFTYEDIQDEFSNKNTKYVRYTKPTNYYEILNICRNYFYTNSIKYGER